MEPATMMAALSIASNAAGAVANFKKSQSEREAALDKQALRTYEAEELQRRFNYNQDLLRQKLNSANQDFLAQYAQSSSGAAGSETSGEVRKGLLENMTKELERAKIEADYEINARKREADALGKQAAAINRSTPFSLASGILGGAKDAYSIFKNK